MIHMKGIKKEKVLVVHVQDAKGYVDEDTRDNT